MKDFEEEALAFSTAVHDLVSENTEKLPADLIIKILQNEVVDIMLVHTYMQVGAAMEALAGEKSASE